MHLHQRLQACLCKASCRLQAVTKAIEMQDKLVEEAKANGSLVETALGTQEY